jgi:type IV secretory pathway TrbD component
MNKPSPIGAPIHRSLTEPELLASMERAPAIHLFSIAAAILGTGGIDWYTIAFSALLLLGGGYALRKLASYDPQFERVAWRYSSYRLVYDAETPADATVGFFGRRELTGPHRPAVPTRREIR